MISKLLKRLQSGEGYTLIEVAISMALTLFILQGIAMVSLHAQRSSMHTRHMTSATMLAEQLMEQYRNKDYDNLAAFIGASPANECFTLHMGGVACGTGDAYFARATTVTNGPIANVVNVDIAVTWEENWALGESPETGIQEAKVVSLISKF